MNEDRLKAALRDVPIPGAEEAERRGREVVARAFAARKPDPRPVLPRLALAVAIATLIAALLLSPAGAAVRDWLGDTFTAGVHNAEPALTDVPGGGHLLVQSSDGSWVVQPDGSRRLIGNYGQATWSPHGLFVGAISGHTLSAVEPDGTVRWALSARAPISDASWSASGFRIAYRTGRALRVVGADGSGDALLAMPVAPVRPVWFPPGLHLLAFVDAGGRLRILESDTGKAVGSAEALPDIETLGWASSGSTLLEASRSSLRVRDVGMSKLGADLTLGTAQRVRLPRGALIHSASFSPRGETIAALLQIPGNDSHSSRSEVVLADAHGRPRRLFGAPGHLSDLTWSPDGRHLLIGWPDADQWLFVPSDGRGRVQAIGGISDQFAPGAHGNAAFPTIDGWCCRP